MSQTYKGSCHCGNVRFEVTGDMSQVVSCNCSICSRMGWLLAFVPDTQFKLLAGEDSLKDYQFGKKHIHHKFCTNCGIRSFGHGAAPGGGGEMMAINVRCLEGIDLDDLTVQKYDGKNL